MIFPTKQVEKTLYIQNTSSKINECLTDYKCVCKFLEDYIRPGI